MKTHHAAPRIQQEWNPCVPPSHLRAAKMQLLTIGGICVYGVWSGRMGEHFTAWCPLLKVTNEVKDISKAAIETFKASSMPKASK